MEDLIADLEKATEPTRMLDSRIHIVLDGNTVVPKYTSSIEAALTLVRKGHEWQCGSANLIGMNWAEVIGPDSRLIGKGATPAIALCIAALKSRAAQS